MWPATVNSARAHRAHRLGRLSGISPEGNTLASGAGSGTGELRGISGTGGFQSSGETTTYHLITPSTTSSAESRCSWLSLTGRYHCECDSRRVASQSRNSRARPMLAQFTVVDLDRRLRPATWKSIMIIW